MPKRPAQRPVLRTPKHGKGKLLVGGVQNPNGNTGVNAGRPPSQLRQRLAGSFEQRVPILEKFADGKIADASPTDRLRALELMAKIGLSGRIDPQWVRDRLAKTVDLVAEVVPAEAAPDVMSKLREIWQ